MRGREQGGYGGVALAAPALQSASKSLPATIHTSIGQSLLGKITRFFNNGVSDILARHSKIRAGLRPAASRSMSSTLMGERFSSFATMAPVSMTRPSW